MANLRVFFVTNRNVLPANKLEVFGPRFNPDGIGGLRYGHADFDPSGELPKLNGVTVYPERKKGEFIQGGSDRLLAALRDLMSTGPSDTLVFIHGYNVTFPEALAAAAKLARDVRVQDRPVNVVLFSWPSDGSKAPFMAYYSDREDARATGPALARAFLKLRDFLIELKPADYCNRCLHLLTHSMGAYVLRNGLQALIAKDPNGLTRVFDQIMLAAPDEDDDTFEHESKLKLLPRLGRQVTVYFNPNDKALVISDKTKANPDRLGSDGPRLVDLIPKKIVLVDCRNVGDGFVEHGYYVESRAMSADLGAVLLGQAPEAIGNRIFVPPERSWRIVREL